METFTKTKQTKTETKTEKITKTNKTGMHDYSKQENLPFGCIEIHQRSHSSIRLYWEAVLKLEEEDGGSACSSMSML